MLQVVRNDLTFLFRILKFYIYYRYILISHEGAATMIFWGIDLAQHLTKQGKVE